ncbi:MAG: phosphoribosyltransferase [Chloroflexi bacterium]|nr:phosphoribosyltransferase [Chloroflexota bacterium]
MVFQDRQEAGRLLAKELTAYQNRDDVLILGIPRGGVVVAYEVAQALRAPLEVYITRKIGAPQNPELAIGAVSSDGNMVIDRGLVKSLGVADNYIAQEATKETAEIQRRLRRYRGEGPGPQIADKTVIVVDDGIATGATVAATLQSLRKSQPKELILAIPVAPRDTLERFKDQADKVICLYPADVFWAVGSFYLEFGQTSDEEVIALLQAASNLKSESS